MRVTALQFRASTTPQSIGLCAEDKTALFKRLNEAIQRLILEGGDNGWEGGWQKIVFNVDPDYPYITLPYGVARVIQLDVCRKPIRLRNEFYEFMPGAPGLRSPSDIPDWYGVLEGYERGTFPTMIDLTTTNQLLRVYYTDVRDVGKRILIKGKDQNGNVIYSTDSSAEIEGFYLTLANPFVTSGFQVSEITNIIKDVTYGDILLYQVDATSGALVLLSRYAPAEQTPEYRRYYIHELPDTCCDGLDTIQVTAIAKLEFVPISRDTDFLLIGNIPALKEECQAIRYSEMDNPAAQQMSILKHENALKLLRKEQLHYSGRQNISVVSNPFAFSPLEDHKIGSIL